MKRVLTLLIIVFVINICDLNANNNVFRSGPRYRLDSVVHTHLYGNIPGNLELSYKYEFYYNSNNENSSYLHSLRDLEKNCWRASKKVERVYNEQGLLSSSIDNFWNSEYNKLEKYYKNEYLYDQNKRIVRKIFFTWDELKETWQKLSKDTLQYQNTNQGVSLKIGFSWDTINNTWKEASQIIYSYNNTSHRLEGYLLKYLDYNSEPPLYKNDMKYDYIYDTVQNQTIYIRYFWNNEEHLWQKSWKGVWSFNPNGDVISFKQLNWASNKWETASESVSHYGLKDEYLGEDYYGLSDVDTVLYLRNKDECSYNYSIKYENLILPLNHKEKYYRYMPIEEKSFRRGEDEQEFLLSGGKKYYYSIVTNPTELISNPDDHNKFNFFPNPVSDYIYIEYDQKLAGSIFELINLNSQQVLSAQINANKVDLTNIPAGIYIFRIITNDEIKSGTLIKK